MQMLDKASTITCYCAQYPLDLIHVGKIRENPKIPVVVLGKYPNGTSR